MGASAIRESLLARFSLMVLIVAMVTMASLALSAREAQALTDSQQRSAAVTEAKRLTNYGTPYVLGMPNPCSQNGADCECMNRLAYAKAGISLQSTLHGQISQGKRTTTPKVGDLIFFDSNGNGQYGNDIDHTGVYVGKNSAGQNMLIHSFKPGGVKQQTVATAKKYNGPAIYVDVISYK